jgi:prostaglandin-H2 D-isomerase / glutathione transferase
MPTYKLTYFDARGVSENIRFMFAVAKQPYEDKRFGFSFGTPGDFSTIQRPEFDAAKAAGELDASLGKVPNLEVDGVKVGQSKAIERFLARELGLAGQSSLEAFQIDCLCEHVVDFKQAYTKAKGTTDADEKEKALKKWFDEDLPSHLALVEKSLPAGPGPFLVGSKVSLADVVFYQFLLAPKGFFDNAEGAKAAFQHCPRIKAALEAVDRIPELQAWIKARPDTMF